MLTNYEGTFEFYQKKIIFQIQPSKNEPSIWIPQTTDPSKALKAVASTSEYSLMLNSKAMKYLDDNHLAHMAMNSPLAQPNNSSYLSSPANVTRFGLPENNASVGTQDFLGNYNLRKDSM